MNRASWAAVAAAVGLVAAACGGGAASSSGFPSPAHVAASPASGGGSPSFFAIPTASASPAVVGSQPSSGPGAQASVVADWTTFFNPSTPIAQREALLQDGPRFIAYLRVQAQPGVAHLTTEQVTAVTVIHTAAVVTYNILVSGVTSPSLSNLSGEATFSGGTWQVSDAGFCNLLRLENKGKAVPGC